MKTLLAWAKRDSDIKINRGLCENYIAANRGHFLLRERTREGEKERRKEGGKERKSVSLWGHTMSLRSWVKCPKGRAKNEKKNG